MTRRLLARTLLLLTGLSVAASVRAADDVRIVTEEYPPYNMTENGRLTGLGTEIVQAVLARTKVRASFQVMPWARAYDTALNADNVLIYSIVHSPQRDKLFKWVGVVAPQHWYLYSMANRHLQLKTLDDARRYQTATVNAEAAEQLLVAKGFSIGTNVQSSARYEFSFEKLKAGRVDLWAAADANAYYLARRAGDDPATMLAPSLALHELDGNGGLEMAFGAKTSDAMVERFREGLEAIKKDGTYDAILKKWL